MKCHKRRLSGLVFCILLVSTLFADSNHTISNELFKYFSKKNVQVDIQYLSNSQSEQFPFNLILTSYAKRAEKNPVYFILSQNEVIQDNPFIPALAEYGTVVLCANMDSALPEEAEPAPLAGLKTFLETAPADAVFIFLEETPDLSEREMQLIPGGKGRIASREVVRSLIHAGQLSDINVAIQSFLLTFYRLDWVDGSEAAALCLENGFQAAGLLYSDKTASPQLVRFASELRHLLDGVTITEGTQYSIINTGTQVLTLSEELYTASLFIIISITLLSSCLLSFMFGKKKLENRRIFLKWWYTGPLLVFIAFGLTGLSQTIVTSLFQNYMLHPIAAILLKSALIAIQFLLLCELRYVIPLAETDYLYSFFMTLSAALDVFILTSADMPLLLPFTCIYLIILSARPLKKWWMRIIIFLILAFPLFFVLFKAAPYLRSDIFASFTKATPLLNFVTGAIFLPYLLMIICIFISLGIWDKNKSRKRKLIETAVLCGLLVITLIITATLHNAEEQLPERDGGVTAMTDGAVSVTANGELRNGQLSFTITLSEAGTPHVLRYDISVQAEAAVPVYQANLPFSFADSAGTTLFRLDENPCSPFILSGTSPASFPAVFTIKAWLSDGSSITTEEHSVTFDEENAGKKHKVRAIIK